MITVRPGDLKAVYKDGKPMFVLKTWEEMMEAYEKCPLKQRLDFYRRSAPEECDRLDSISKLSVELEDFYVEDGANWVILYALPKRKNIAEARRQEYADMATEDLQGLGFDTVYNFKDQGKGSGLAAADIICEYDIKQKPYTITSARVQDMVALNKVVLNPVIKIDVARKYVDPETGKEVIEKVPAAEFKKAVKKFVAEKGMLSTEPYRTRY